MLKRLLNWFLGKDAPAKVTQSMATNGHRAATMIAEAKPIIRAAGPVAAPVAAVTQGASAIVGAASAASAASTATVTSKATAATVRRPEQHEISLRAHQIWLERGGDATSNWLQAERELTERLNRR